MVRCKDLTVVCPLGLPPSSFKSLRNPYYGRLLGGGGSTARCCDRAFSVLLVLLCASSICKLCTFAELHSKASTPEPQSKAHDAQGLHEAFCPREASFSSSTSFSSTDLELTTSEEMVAGMGHWHKCGEFRKASFIFTALSRGSLVARWRSWVVGMRGLAPGTQHLIYEPLISIQVYELFLYSLVA